jgi:hypothetical protein
MLKRQIFCGAIALLILMSQPAQAGRLVLNQSPATIEKSFGKYWTKLTRMNGKEKTVTYTYSPTQVQSIFPKHPKTTLSMVYVNDKVQSVTISPYRTEQERRNGATEITYPEQLITPEIEAKLFEGVFGFRAPIHKPLYLNYGSFYSYINCLGNGVASSYSIHLGERLVGGVTISYKSTCEPPYDRIRYTEEKGPSGG